MENEEQQEEITTAHGCDIESPDISECNEKINLKGPFSPLEMRVYGITNSSYGKDVKIEFSSVNTVLLDAEPQDPHTRYVKTLLLKTQKKSVFRTLKSITGIRNCTANNFLKNMNLLY